MAFKEKLAVVDDKVKVQAQEASKMAVNSLVDALEEGRSVHYGELVLWVLQVLEHKHSGDNSTFSLT